MYPDKQTQAKAEPPVGKALSMELHWMQSALEDPLEFADQIDPEGH